jgi:hypothetical protein
MGRIDIGIAASDSSGNTLYASIADASTSSNTNIGVFVSSNGGSTWTSTNAPDICQDQCWYDNVIKVDPTHSGTVFFGGSAVTDSNGVPQWVLRSTNSGSSWASAIPNITAGNAGLPHVDNHAMAFAKLSTGKVRLYLGNDGGIWRTDDAEASSIQWTNLNNSSLTLTQFYPSISMNTSSPAIAFGGTQDNGSQNYEGGSAWEDNQLCGDGGTTSIDAVIPSTVYIGCGTGNAVNASYQNGVIGSFSAATNGINPNDSSSFIPPIVVDPNVANVLYFGTTGVYQSVDSAVTWTPITGPLANGPGDYIAALAVAPGNSSVLYAGGFHGGVFAANNVAAGTAANFTQVSGQLTLPPRALTAIAVDAADATGMTAYVAFSGFSFVNTSLGVNDPTGHIFKTSDGGKTWTDVSCSVATTSNCAKPAAADLPNIPVNDIVADPDVPGALYAATDLGVFVGDCAVTPCAWTTLGTGLPRVAVLSLRLHEPSRTLRAATHGRGAWDIHLNNFSFSGPHISSITPVSVNAGGTQFTLTVNGSGLVGGAIQFGSTALTSTGTSSDSSLSGIVPTSLLTAGTVQITVKISSAASNGLPFPVLALTPTLTGVTPSSTPVQATPSSNVTIQLTGTNFASNAKVFFNGAQNGIIVAAPGSSCPLPTCLKATLPAALLGPYGSTNDITVLDPPPGGGSSLAKTFRVAALAPPNDNIANATNITTLSFGDTQDSSGASTETTDPIPPCVTQFSSANGNTGGHPNGLYNTIWYKFVPQFSANLSLDTIGSSYDTVLSVWSGNPGGLVNVACNDDIIPGVQVQSQLSGVALTAGSTYYVMVGSFGPPDPNPVALGGRSQLNFSYNGGVTPVPKISAVSPNSAKSGDPATAVTVNGTGFLNGAVVLFQNPAFGTLNPESTTFVSATQLKAVISAADIVLPGTYQLFVQNAQPAIGTSNGLPFTVNVGTYPVPTITSLTPSSTVAGDFPFTLDVGGTNFASTAVLNFNGAALPTTVYNPGFLYAVVPASAIANAGTAQVTVTNPGPGGGPSNSISFTIAAPNPVPTIASVSPSSAQSGSALTYTVTGTGYIGGAQVCVNFPSGLSCSVAGFLSSTQLSIFIPLYSVPAGNYSLYVTDPAPGGTSAPFNLTVTGPPDFTIGSTGTTSMTVAAGSPANFTNAITIAPQSGFSAVVSLNCSLPAKAVACTVSPNSFANGSGTASVNVTTTSRGMMPPSAPFGYFFPTPPQLVATLAAMMMLVFWQFARTRRQRLAVSVPLTAVLLFLAIQLMGCGGGGSITPPPPPPPPTGTAAGTYTITVTATSGNLTHSTTLSLTVQ